MKTRNGFVSNSSSSSFLIARKHLSDDQVEKINNYATCGWEYADDGWWSVNITNEQVSGHTPMDNFDMLSWLLKVVGVPSKYIRDEEETISEDELKDIFSSVSPTTVVYHWAKKHHLNEANQRAILCEYLETIPTPGLEEFLEEMIAGADMEFEGEFNEK